MKEFKDKVAVITGAASGIGYALAEHAANEGMKVVLADVEEAALKQAQLKIKNLGVDTLAVKTDVSKSEDVKSLAEKTLKTFGAVHLLFNNAGVGVSGPTWACSLSDWQWVLGVNLWGVIHGIHHFVPSMIEQECECHVINTASIAGLTTGAGYGPYCVSKHAIVALSENLYYEFKQQNHDIGVSVLCPGVINTNIIHSERNRPKELRNKPGEGLDDPNPETRAAIAQVFEKGMESSRVAEIVFNGIREKRFYLLPNGEPSLAFVRSRMDDVLKGRNPSADAGF